MIPVIFIPSAPLLLPTLNPTPLPEHVALRATIAKVCEPLQDASRFIIIGGAGAGQRPDARTHEAGLEFFPSGLPGCEAQFDGTSHKGAPPVLPLSLTIGRWALTSAIPGRLAGPFAQTGSKASTIDGDTDVVLVFASGSADTIGSAIAEVSSTILAPSADTAVIVVGDGTATRHEKAPGHTVAGAVELDDHIADMLGSGDFSGLMQLPDDHDETFALDGRCAWQAAAALIHQWPVSLAAGTLLEYTAPHHVAYFVARWDLELTG